MSKRNTRNSNTPTQTAPAEPTKEETTTQDAKAPEENTEQTEVSTQDTQSEDTTVKAAPEEQKPEPEETKSEETTEVSKKGVSESLVKALNSYVQKMNPVNPIAPAEGLREQKRLRGAILNAITEPGDEEALANIRYILDFIHAVTTGCFEMATVFRFFDSSQWTVASERKEMETLMTLFMATAEPSSRGKEARRLDWNAMATHIAPARADVVMDRLRQTYGID
jgi:hypothetical protein